MNRTSNLLFAAGIIGLAACVVAGWGLSLIGGLTPAGYFIALPLLVAGLGWLVRDAVGMPRRHLRWLPLLHRFRRPLPAIFLLVAALVFLGGLLYAPVNFDALTYRLPRMLNWQTAGHWCWIPTINQRMNFSGTTWEWMAMPLLVVSRSDRGMFLINALGFLLMPGLLFSIFRQLGMARRVAWTWMWLVPLGYGYATQAGSIGNDLTGTIFGLLSVYFGLRARRSGQAGDVWLALMAAALMTGVKLSNLPLALPCLVAVWPALIRQWRRWPAGMVAAIVCVIVSALPIMGLNWKYTGSWTGDPQNQCEVQAANPAAALAANSFLLAERSLMPPLLPHSNEINRHLMEKLPNSLKAKFPRLTVNNLPEIPGEESAGLGLGLTLPLLLGALAAILGLRRSGRWKRIAATWPPVALAAWVALLFYLLKAGSEAGPRLLLPYYPLVLVPFLLMSAQRRWLQRKSWRMFLTITALGILPVLVLSVSRPLWPALSTSDWLARTHPENRILSRLTASYGGYAHRNDFLAPIRSNLPENVKVVGFIAGGNDSSYSLWRPLGRRRVLDLRSDEAHFLAHPDGAEWVVIKENQWPEISPVPLETWAREHRAEIVCSIPLVELISWGPESWCLVHFPKPET